MVQISVIIPVFNGEKYLADCLDSILAQNYENYEIICVDDGSIDRSSEILMKYSKKSNRIKIINHLKNRGLSAARNTGMENAKGKYILFVDADDKIIPETLEELFFYAEENKTDLIYFNMEIVHEMDIKYTQKGEKNISKKYPGIYTGKDLFCLFIKDNNLKIEAWRQFYRKDFLVYHNIQFLEGILHEDNLFSFLCAMEAERVININKDYYLYRQHIGSIMTTVNEQRLKSLFVIIMEIFKYWNSHSFSDLVNRSIADYFEKIWLSFIYYRDNFCQYTESELGTYAENIFYSLIIKGRSEKYVHLSKKKIEILRNAGRIIVFGAGRAASDVIYILKRENIKIDAVAVSNIKISAKVYCGIEVKEIGTLVEYQKDAVIVIGLTEKYRKNAENQLRELGFCNLMAVDT